MNFRHFIPLFVLLTLIVGCIEASLGPQATPGQQQTPGQPPLTPPIHPSKPPELLEIDLATLEEASTDILGLYSESPNYQTMMNAGARVVNLDAKGTFFLVWVPDGYSELDQRRVMVAVHGSDGTAYAQAEHELEMARRYGYAIVGIQWWLGRPEVYLSPSEMYPVVDVALRYMKLKYDSELDKVCYEGFSRGSANSYEVTFWDRYIGTNYFSLTVSHSGGIPPDQLTPFFKELLSGKYGSSPFQGTHFFMYCGMKDEEWGIQQCCNMRFTKGIIEQYGAKIERFIEDPNGSHGGYHNTAEYHESAIQIFIGLTSS